ncbi:MAG: FUSC family protein [Odoribacter sp.]|nr:FUSC family protein [Odoribacter sp.]
MRILEILRRVHIGSALVKCTAVLLSYVFGAYVTSRLHGESGSIGAMLACTSSLVVLQEHDLKHSLHNGWLRIFGTFIGALLGWIYLLFYPFSILGLLVAVFLLEIICMLLQVPDNGKMATVTLVIILVTAHEYRSLPSWENGLFRFLEAVVGAGIGIFMVWVQFLFQRLRERWKGRREGVE